MKIEFPKKRRRLFKKWAKHTAKLKRGFSLVDLTVVIGFVAIFALWFGFGHFGERGRIARCAWNLDRLGQATQACANDHDDGIPAATIFLGKEQNTWRMDLAPFLKPGLQEPKSVYDRKSFLKTIEPFFSCPSDLIRRPHPCSYSMSAHDMSAEDWPPDPDNKTGMGIWWDKTTVSTLLGNDMIQNVTIHPDLLPRLKMSVLPDPANTLMLTEFINRNNTLGSMSFAWVWRVAQQQVVFRDDPFFHFGKFNYLMADGHVELLTGLQTGGIGDPPSGIWTIKHGD